MMSTRIRCLVALMVLWGGACVAVLAQSDEVRVSAEVSSTEVGAQKSVVFTVRVQGRQLNFVETPEPPVTTNLVLDNPTPSTQRNVSITNRGQMERSVTYRWIYEPMRTGSASLGPVDVTVAGTTYTTEEIRLTIVSQSQRPSLSSTTPHGARPSPQSPNRPQREDRIGARDLFIRAEPSETRVYQNEQVTLEYRLFFRPRVQLRHSRLASAWDANGFWREELDVASHPRPRTRRVDGRTYRSIILKRVAVFPTRPGTLRVDPLRIETEAYSTDPYNQTLRRGFEPITLASDPLTIEARPLPSDPPPTFQGAVGQYALDVALSTDSVQVGDAVRVRATVQGQGNLAILSPPVFQPPADFETYEPESSTDVNRSGRVVRGTKTFTYTLIPRTNGRFTIPSVQFTTFNPDTRTYETLQSAPRTLHVTGDAAPTAVSTTGDGLPVGDVASLMSEPRWVRTETVPLHRQPWMYVALTATVLLGIGSIVYRREGTIPVAGLFGEEDASPDVPPAVATVECHLGRAERALRNGETKTLYREIERGLLGFLRERTGDAATGSSHDVLDAHLASAPMPPADREALHDLLDACEEAQFTPQNPTYDRAAVDLSRARRLLRNLNDALPEDSDAMID